MPVSYLFRFLQTLIRAGRRTGSLRDLNRRIVFIYTNEGFKGIRNRLIKVNRNDYSTWIKKYDTLTSLEFERIKRKQVVFPYKPLISILMTVYDTKEEWLVKAIESVRRQSYSNWELCIADDASTNPRIVKILNNYKNEDCRIKVVFRKINGHIAACSNSALEIANGDWIALLDHDDEISSTALFWVVEAINKLPEVKLIYSDEDKIDQSGIRSSPYFKSDWNLDLFYSQNMYSHLGVYNTDLVKKAGGFRKGFEGSQDYDLVLRCIELIKSDQIYHIPRVLYHWRIHKESTANSAKSKPYAMLAGERALNEHFLRSQTQARAHLIGYGYRIKYTLPDTPPMVSIIIPTRNKLQLLRKCIDSIRALTTYPNFEIIVIDNDSDDPETLEYLEDQSKASNGFRILKIKGPFNYSSLNNQAVKESHGDYITLINNDVQVINAEWLDEMIGLAIQPGVGAVGAKLYYPNDTIQHAGIILGLGFHHVAGCAHNRINKGNKGYFGRASLANSFSALTAACLVIRKNIFTEIGGLNETDLPVSYNDVDFCLRVGEAGYRNVFTPYAELYHAESSSRDTNIANEDPDRRHAEMEYFKKCWSHLILKDPAYNPNLSLEFSDFSLAWPPRIETDTQTL